MLKKKKNYMYIYIAIIINEWVNEESKEIICHQKTVFSTFKSS